MISVADKHVLFALRTTSSFLRLQLGARRLRRWDNLCIEAQARCPNLADPYDTSAPIGILHPGTAVAVLDPAVPATYTDVAENQVT